MFDLIIEHAVPAVTGAVFGGGAVAVVARTYVVRSIKVVAAVLNECSASNVELKDLLTQKGLQAVGRALADIEFEGNE